MGKKEKKGLGSCSSLRILDLVGNRETEGLTRMSKCLSRVFFLINKQKKFIEKKKD